MRSLKVPAWLLAFLSRITGLLIQAESNQVGCIYTAKGFDLDYVGVIFGLDLRYDVKTSSWVGDRTQGYDSVVKGSGEQFLNLVKYHIESYYRVV
jgi:DUF2075 family protein